MQNSVHCAILRSMDAINIAGIGILLANLWAIIRTVRSDADVQKKVLWVVFVLVAPFVGVVAWIIFGPS